MSDFLVLNTERDLYGGLKGEKFKVLIQYCFEEADYFSLSKWDRPSYTNAVEDMLEPYKTDTLRTQKWFAYNGADFRIETVYEATSEAMDIILNCYQDIFLENTKRVPKKKHEQIGKEFLYPDVLEDICFFQNKQMFLGTLSHEYICAARLISSGFEEKLQSLALWKRMEKDIFNLNEIIYY